MKRPHTRTKNDAGLDSRARVTLDTLPCQGDCKPIRRERHRREGYDVLANDFFAGCRGASRKVFFSTHKPPTCSRSVPLLNIVRASTVISRRTIVFFVSSYTLRSGHILIHVYTLPFRPILLFSFFYETLVALETLERKHLTYVLFASKRPF